MQILLTGGAGFIGSNLCRALLQDERVTRVRVLDNLSTGYRQNLQDLQGHPKFEWMEGDITDLSACDTAMQGIDLVSHQAALGSVPRSIADPVLTNTTNISGTLHIYDAARRAGVRRVVYAASSSTYGDHPGLPKTENVIGRPLSPYAVTKYVMELYAGVFARTYGMTFTGLRYFNVFGPHQSPRGAYAAVIPLFMDAVISGIPPLINGDGSYSRDFTYVDNVVQANLRALFDPRSEAVSRVYNVAYGQSTTLLDLFRMIRDVAGSDLEPVFGPFRQGDIPHSLADITLARQDLGYEPAVSVQEGLKRTFAWYRQHRHFFE